MDDTIRGKSGVNDITLEESASLILPLPEKETKASPQLTNTDEIIDLVSNKIFSSSDKKVSENKQEQIICNKHEKERLICLNEENPKKVKIKEHKDPKKAPVSSIYNSRDNEQLIEISNLLEIINIQFEKNQLEQIIRIIKLLNRESLGKLIYLLNELTIKEFLKIDTKNEKQLSKWIDDKFEKHIEERFNKLAKLKKQYESTKFQNTSLAMRNNFAVELSHILISKTGSINFGIIDLIIKNYLPPQTDPPKYRNNLIHTLETFRDKALLRKKFAEIEGPSSKRALSNTMIRAVLRLSVEEDVQVLEAKKSVFAALISHLRQGKEGSCFATPLAIILHTLHIERCLDDFAMLIKENKLTRRTNNITHDFPFILKMSGTDLENPLNIDKKGILRGSRGKIYHAPGILAAARAIGFVSVKEPILEILKTYNEESIKQLTLKTLFQKLVQEAKKLPINQKEGVGTLYLRLAFTFEAQENNALLQIWSNAIAGMAEAEETGMIRSAIIEAVMKTLSKKLAEILPTEEDFKTNLEKTLYQTLINHLHLQYDPVIYASIEGVGKTSPKGAFVLYDKTNSLDVDKWTRVDNPQLFSEFIFQIVKKTIKDVIPPNTEIKSLKTACTILQKYPTTNEFILSILKEYYHQNGEIPEPIKNYEKILYAPWVTKSGNDFSKVVQVYFESFIRSKSEVYYPKNAKDLLLKIIKIEKKLKSSNKDKSFHVKMIPTRIPKVHAFNIILSHQTMITFFEQNEKSSEWINKNILLPGKQLSETTIEKLTYENFIIAIKERIIPNEMKYLRQNSKLNKPYESKSIKSLRTSMLETLKKIFHEQNLSVPDLSNQIDLILLETLSEEQKKEIQSKAVHFADTNWSDGVHDIHLCFLVNPGSGELEVFASYDNSEKFFPLNANEWIAGKKWEFFLEICQENI